eukprot:TRINITY_DN63417_c0_g1_i1.p1 TRINITY_DN63417_c0_g1~~TRINITY_DN63417_c0_g1_i1.p1  ORF type:complete len:805 (+),score=119.58 TRINITY_DN63417_c0_g1_i1:71-2485(+)
MFGENWICTPTRDNASCFETEQIDREIPCEEPCYVDSDQNPFVQIWKRLADLEEKLDAQEAKTALLVAGMEAKLLSILMPLLPEQNRILIEMEGPVQHDIKTQDPTDVVVDGAIPEAADCRDVTYDDAKELYASDGKWELSDSVWDASFIAWTPACGVLGSVFLSAVLILNITIQLLFCWVANEVFANAELSTFHPDIVDEVSRWRINDAHSKDRMDKSSWVSLATRVCELDESLVFGNSQMNLYMELGKYTSPLTVGKFDVLTGSLLAIVCLLLWYFTVVQDVFASVDFINVMCTIPNSGMQSRMVMDAENMFVMEAIGWPRRLCLMSLTCLRVFIAGWVLLCGGMWLCLTSSLPDLILNAAALAFVLDCDELLFATLAPPMVKRTIAQIAPLKRTSIPVIRGLGLQGPIALLVCFIFVAGLKWTHMDPMVDRMSKVDIEMCGGEKRFVLDVSKNLGYAVVVPTRPINSDSINTFMKATKEFTGVTVDELTSLANLPLSKQGRGAVVVGTETDFNRELQKTSADFIAPMCDDEMHVVGEQESVHLAWLEGLRSVTSRHNATGCKDFQEYCRSFSSVGMLVRSFCSNTCQCGTILSALIDRDGCTNGCAAMTQVELSSPKRIDGRSLASCIDVPVEEFSEPEQVRMLADYEEILGVKLPVEKFKELGCKVLFSPNGFEVFSPEIAPWVPDALCGRTTGSNIAIKNLRYQSLRWMCPVSCGCSIDFSSECPASCKKGALYTAVDACSQGLCPGEEVSKDAVFQEDACLHIDEMLKANHNLSQAQCEAMVDLAAPTCCCPSGRFCG